MPAVTDHTAMRALPEGAGLLRLALFLPTTFVAAAVGDSLAVGEFIKDNQTLVSAEGTFALGFFSTTGSPKQRYLGIWYNKIPARTVVWVANRRRPLPDATGSVTLSASRSLDLADGKGTSYWTTGPAPGLSNPVARLLDSGNLVLLDGGGDRYAWQSFNNPSDTILPGMRIGLDRRTGQRFNITGWRSPDDPAPGDYACGLDAQGVPQLVVTNGSALLWRGGPWLLERFTGVPSMKASNNFRYGFISNQDSLFVQYDVWNTSWVTRITMNRSGSAEHLRWDDGSSSWAVLWASTNDTCDRFNACGVYGVCDADKPPVCSCLEGFEVKQRQQEGQRGDTGAAVCERKEHHLCPNGGEDTFVLVSGVKLPDTTAATADMSIGFDGCREKCLGNCSCTAFTRTDGSGCITWFGDLTDVRLYSVDGQDLYVRIASRGEKDQKKVIILILVLIAFIAIMLSILIWLYKRRQISRKRLKEMQRTMQESNVGDRDQRNDFELPLFQFSTLELATNYFSFQNKLGEGGYGPVYKGNLHDGQSVAIKRLSRDSTQGLEQFKSEVQLVAKLQHTNLVRLLGCCIEKEEKILVYEYMLNQSLDMFIFDRDRARQLDWMKRLHIIEGITQGLLYLHKYSRLTVIHRDLKASNILLDDQWNPKISDFGLARIFNWNEPQANTKRIIGTYGYMPPEYAMKGLFSVKSDVFSFGILLLEILSGKKNTSINDFGISQNLHGHAWELWREGREIELMDSTMGDSVPRNEFSKCVHVALLCVQENPMDRPTMLDIVSMLNNDITSLPTPKHPAFFLVRRIDNGNNLDIEHLSSSNSVTFTGIEGR